ncbi:MAG TPA: PhoH family protein [Balneolales bacterium]|nr:PhoH family protein [Balneolales bacterium]
MPRTKKKTFVLDTSVILYDHDALYSFQEHDVAIPITVLEEVDQFKKGNDIINMHAREFSRILDRLSGHNMLQNWISLNGSSRGKFRVIMDTESELDANKVFGSRKNDHDILNTALVLAKKEPSRNVVLVTKDINLRVKARALNLQAEDYETGKIKNVESLSKGKTELIINDNSIIDRLYSETGIPYREILDERPACNHYYILKNDSNSALAFFNPQTEQIERVMKSGAYGIKPRNAEQTFALHALMNNDVKLLTISGVAGTGKTLLALAGALESRRFYHQIYMARPIVPLSNRDIGYLPGDIKSKINPYMQPLWDNLDFIKSQFTAKSKDYLKIEEMIENEKLFVTPLAYIRGRSLSNIFFIVDEAQNLTPHEVKTIITRAGESTKIVFTGDIYQIDTPYLDAQSNGLSYLIDRISNHPLYAHIHLERGERSELANLASDML